MANLRIQGDTSGYIDIAAPDVADGSTIDLGQVSQLGSSITKDTYMVYTNMEGHAINRNAGDPYLAYYTGGTYNNVIQYGGASTGYRVFTNAGESFKVDHSGYVTTPNQPSFSAVKNAGNQTITGGSGDIKVTGWSLNSETSNSFSTVDSRFTAPISGRYYVIASIMSQCTGGDYQVKIFKNGSSYVISNDMQTSSSTWIQTTVPAVLHLNAGDYVEVYVRTSISNLIYGSSSFTHFHGYLIG